MDNQHIIDKQKQQNQLEINEKRNIRRHKKKIQTEYIQMRKI